MFLNAKPKILLSLIYEYSRVILLIFVLVIGLGAFSAIKIPWGLEPGHSEHVVTIITEYPDIDSETIKNQITRPIERVLKNTRGVLNFYSFSSRGRSRLICYFDADENIDEFIIRLSDSIYQVSKDFPAEVRPPLIYRYNTDDSPVMIISAAPNASLSGAQTWDLLENGLKAKLLSIDGVANVKLAGAEDHEYRILLNYSLVNNLKLNYMSLFKYIASNNSRVPIGSFTNDSIEEPLRFLGKYKSLPEVEDSEIRLKNTILRGKDVLKVSNVESVGRSFSMINNREAIIFYIYRQADSPALSVENSVDKIFNNYSESLSWKTLYSQGLELKHLYKKTGIAIGVSFFILFCFLFFIYKKAFLLIPVFSQLIFSLSGTILMLYISSAELNILSIAGIIIGLLFSIFFSILLLENFVTGWNSLENRRRGAVPLRPDYVKIDEFTRFKSVYKKKPPEVTNVINEAMLDSALPVIATTVISAVVFIPLFFVTRGIGAKLWLAPYRDFALSLFLMMIWATASSFTVFPILLLKVMGAFGKASGLNKSLNKNLESDFKRPNHFFGEILPGFFKSFNFGILSHNQKRRSKIFWYGTLMFIGIFTAASFYFAYLYYTSDYHEIDLLKRNNKREFYYQFNPGFTKKYRINETKRIVQNLLKNPSINPDTNKNKINGGPNLVATLEGDRITFYTIAPEKSGLKGSWLKELKKEGLLSYFNLNQKKIKKSSSELKLFENIRRNDGFFYQQGKGSIPGMVSSKILIFGDDISKLNKLTDVCAKKILGISGVKQIIKGYRKGTAEISIVPDISKLFFYSLNYDEVASFLRYMFYQPVIFKHYRGNSLIDVRAGFNLSEVNRSEDAAHFIANVEVPVNGGKKSIRIMDFASIKRKNVSSEISRKNGKLYIPLDIRYSSGEKERVLGRIKDIMDSQSYSLGEYYTINENGIDMTKTRTSLFLSSIITLFLIWFFLTIFFKSFALPLLLLLGFPFIFIGEGLFKLLTGVPRSIPFELSIAGATIFFIYIEIILIEGFVERKNDKNGDVDINTVESVFVSKSKVVVIIFAVFVLFLAPLLITPGTGYLFKAFSGSILISLIFILIFFLAILPLICIIGRCSSKL